MGNTGWLYVVGASIVAFGSILSAIIYNWRDKDSYERQKAHLTKTRDIYDIMNDTLADTSATRFIIFCTHNGGGMPSVTKSFKVSALYGSNIKIDTKHQYQNLIVDEEYTRMLLEIQNKGIYKFDTEVEESKLLQKIYTAEGIKISNLYYLCNTNSGMLYCSIASHNSNIWKGDVAGGMDELKFELTVNKLKLLFDNEKKNNQIHKIVFRFLKALITRN